MSEAGTATAASLPSLPTAYMPSAHDCAGAVVSTIDPVQTHLYVALDAFLVGLLADTTTRATSSSCAEIVWAPLFGRRLYGNIDRGVWAQLAAAVADLRPRGAGLPYLHEVHLDTGPCDLPIGIFRARDVVLSYYGRTDCFLPGVHYVVAPPGARHDLSLQRCTPRPPTPHRPRVENCTPTLWTAKSAPMVAAAQATYAANASPPLHAPRRRALFFRGSSREQADSTICYLPNRSLMLGGAAAVARRCGGVYSLGIRQAVRRELAHLPIVDFGRPGARFASTAAYHRALRGVQWCLTAPGYGFGARIVDYVACGCIPVVVRAEQPRVLLPYEPELDYRSFAVIVDFADVPRLPALLEAMDERKLYAKRERLREIHRAFLWDDHYGTAYEAVRDAVLAKVRGGVGPSLLEATPWRTKGDPS